MSIANLLPFNLSKEETQLQVLEVLENGSIDISGSVIINADVSANSIIRDISMNSQTTDVNVNVVNSLLDVSVNNILKVELVDVDFSTVQTEDLDVNITNTLLDVSVNNLVNTNITNSLLDVSVNNLVDVSINNLVDCSANLQSEYINNDYKFQHNENRYYIFNEHYANFNSANFATQSGSIRAYKGWNVNSGGLNTIEKEIIQGAKYMIFEFTTGLQTFGTSSNARHQLNIISEPISVDRLTRTFYLRYENSSLKIYIRIIEENGSTYEQIIDKADFLYDKFDGIGPTGFNVNLASIPNLKQAWRIIVDNYGSANFQRWVHKAQRYVTFHSLNYLENTTIPNNSYTLAGNYVSCGFTDSATNDFWVDRFSLYLTDDDTILDLPIVQSKPQMTDAMNAFDEFRVNELEPLFQYNFRFNFNDRLFLTKTSGAGASVSSSYPNVSVFATSGAARYAVLTSIIPCHYRNGQEAVCRMTVRNQSRPDPTSTKLAYNFWGFGDRCDDGATTIPRNFIGFTYNGFDGLCVAIKNNDDTPSAFSTLYLPQEEWNRKHNLLMTINNQRMNLFEIRFVYLGQRGVQFRIFDTAQNKMVTVHEYIHANQVNTPFVDNPILSFCLGVTTEATSTQNGQIEAHSIMLAIQGKNMNFFPDRAINTNSGAVATNADILVLGCRNQYATYDNYDRFFIKSITASATNSGSNSTSLLFYKNSSYSAGPTLTNLDTNNSIIEYAALGEAVGSVGTVSSLGVLVYSVSLSSGGGSVSIEDLNKIYLEPNSTINIRVKTSGGNSTVDLSVIFEEDI